MKKKDIFLLLSVIGAAVIILSVFAIFRVFGDGDTVTVSIDGEILTELPLNEDTEYRIESDSGYNLLVIKDGKAYISEASCPDKICVKTGAADEITSIVCLPNKVVVSIEKD